MKKDVSAVLRRCRSCCRCIRGSGYDWRKGEAKLTPGDAGPFTDPPRASGAGGHGGH